MSKRVRYSTAFKQEAVNQVNIQGYSTAETLANTLKNDITCEDHDDLTEPA
ncbi:hypothetical protein [Aliidiomarina shirensis]|uniref:hypothetical protein n=1 Tax=Aliidiomarina shirensis TaxID=1048642 RepID=UPI00130054C9|nr:hypothetical protein [Aliidiomarina shirensis]